MDENDRILESSSVVSDIVQPEQIEDRFCTSGERFREMLENLRLIAVILDVHARVIFVNDYLLDKIGRQRHEVIGRDWFECVLSPEEAEKDRARFFAFMETKSEMPIHYEGHIHTAGGGIRLISWNNSFLKSSRGEIIEIASIGEDITERRQFELALQRERDLVARIMETSPVGITTINRDGMITFANTQAEKLLGLKRDEIVKRQYNAAEWNITDIDNNPLPDEELPFNQAVKSGKPVFNIRHALRWNDGRRKLLSINASPVLDQKGHPEYIIATMDDITDRVRAEWELQENERKYHLLFNQMVDGFVLSEIIYDEEEAPVDFRILEANSAFERMIGIKRSDMLQRTAREVFPDVELEWIGTFGEVGSTGTPAHFEYYAQSIDRHLSITAFSPQKGQVVSIFTDISEQKRAEHRIQQQVEQLTALRKIDALITANHHVEPVLRFLVKQVISLLKVDAAGILLYQSQTSQLQPVAHHGFFSDYRTNSCAMNEPSIMADLLDRRKIVQIGTYKQVEFPQGIRCEEDGFVTYIAAPLEARDEVKGILEVYNRSPLKPDSEWLSFFKTLVGQAVIAIENTQLFEDLQRSNLEIKEAYEATIEGWSQALELRDKETKGHSERVVEFTLKLARLLEVPESTLEQYKRGVFLHDIGKMGVPDSILLKPGPLTDDEWVIMRQHPTYAFRILSRIPYLDLALDIPCFHHEKWDGSGYPFGLKAEEIPLAARIFAVVDVWDALTSDRPYRPAWERGAVLNYLSEQSGKHFDPKVVEVFMKIINDIPN